MATFKQVARDYARDHGLSDEQVADRIREGQLEGVEQDGVLHVRFEDGTSLQKADTFAAPFETFSTATPQASQEEASVVGIPQNQASSLTITVITDSASRRYSERTTDATLSALRADILQGTIPREAKTTFETKTGNAKPQIRAGTLLKCASPYALLADLYTPVRRHARAGMEYGILTGVLLYITVLGFSVSQTNQKFGAIIMVLPVCVVVTVLLTRLEINIPIIQTPCLLGFMIIPGYLGFNGLFPALLGAGLAGGILFSMPGMTIGAIVGTVRRPRLPRAYDASHENAMLRITIPLVISIALWAAYLILAWGYLQTMMK